MMDGARVVALPAWAADLRYACPHCRTGIELVDGHAASCSSCGFVASFDRGVYRFLPQSSPVSDWQDTYDRVATGALEDTKNGLLYRAPIDQRIDTYRILCGEIPDDARIIDVGCANGIFAEILFEGRPIVGVDFSFEMCLQARDHGVLAHQADALALPFASDQFDLVCVAGVLEHIDDLSGLCAELARVCRPGGRVVLGTGNSASLARRVMRIVRRMKPAPIAVMRLPVIVRTLDELLSAAQAVSLELDLVCWTYFPLPWHRCSTFSHDLLEPLASNVYACFSKR